MARRRTHARGRLSGVWGDDRTPLHEAAAKGHVDMVRLLLTHGADPNATATDLCATLLSYAVLFADSERLPELVQLLLENGASPNIGNCPPLCDAIWRRDQVARSCSLHTVPTFIGKTTTARPRCNMRNPVGLRSSTCSTSRRRRRLHFSPAWSPASGTRSPARPTSDRGVNPTTSAPANLPDPPPPWHA